MISVRFILKQYVRFWKDLYYALRVRKCINRTRDIKKGDVLLLACHNNWDDSLPNFCAYYRALGVKHFLFIDYGKAQTCRRIARDIPDATVFTAKGGFRKVGNGAEWKNVVLKRHGRNHFCVLAEPGEYLVFPFQEDRKIGELASFLKNERKDSLHAVCIDAYARDPEEVRHADRSTDPFALCPYFDGDGYYHRNIGDATASVVGGPSLRLSHRPEPSTAPYLNRIVGVWWKWNYYFLRDGRTARPPKLNRIFDWNNPVISAAMFRFPQIDAAKGSLSLEAMIRVYGKEVANAAANGKDLYADGISTNFKSSSDLMEMGLISSGNWI